MRGGVIMRFAISIVAALMILGLAAFGIVSAQKMSTAPSQTSDSSAAPASQPVPSAERRHSLTPVSQVAEVTQKNPETSSPVAVAPAAPAPMRVAEPTQTPAATAPSAPAAPPKPAPSAAAIPPCYKAAGLGLTRVIEIDTT